MKGKAQFDFVNNVGLCAGDMANLYLGKVNDSKGKITPVVMKVARQEADNDLLKREGETMLALSKHLNPQYARCVPQILDSFQVKAENGDPRPWCNVMEFCAGFVSVEDIRKLSTGVDGRTLVWMFKRLLSLLSWVHRHGFVHGAILPPHVLYWPDGSVNDERAHTVRLVDWAYAIEFKKEQFIKAWVPDYRDFYPPEVLTKIRPVMPSVDIYMAAATMCYVAGGDVRAKKFPSSIPGKLATQFKLCLNANHHGRPQTVSQIYDSFTEVAKEVYGAPKFHQFNLTI